MPHIHTCSRLSLPLLMLLFCLHTHTHTTTDEVLRPCSTSSSRHVKDLSSVGRVTSLVVCRSLVCTRDSSSFVTTHVQCSTLSDTLATAALSHSSFAVEITHTLFITVLLLSPLPFDWPLYKVSPYEAKDDECCCCLAAQIMPILSTLPCNCHTHTRNTLDSIHTRFLRRVTIFLAGKSITLLTAVFVLLHSVALPISPISYVMIGTRKAWSE